MAVGEGRETYLPGNAPRQDVAAQAHSAALQPGPARNEFTVKYLKGKHGFAGKMDGVVVLVDGNLRFRNRGGDRAFTIALDSAQARVGTKQKQRIGCWAGLSVLAPTMLFDPERQCRKTEYLVEIEVAAPGGAERVVFKPADAEASALVAAINHRSPRAASSPSEGP